MAESLDLDMDFSFSADEEDIQDNDGGEIRPYQFEPTISGLSGSEGDSADDENNGGSDNAMRLQDTSWFVYCSSSITICILYFTKVFMYSLYYYANTSRMFVLQRSSSS